MEIFRCFGACLKTEVVAQDVEGCSDVVGADGLVDAVVADGGQQGAGDFAVAAFLVVAHQGQQFVVIVAGEGEITIIVAHEVAQQVHVIAGEFQQ